MAVALNELAALLTSRINPSLLPQYAPAPAGELRYSIANITAAQRALGFERQRTLSSDIDGVIADIAQRQRTRR